MISALAITTFAEVTNMVDFPDLEKVTIITKEIRPCAPQTEMAFLETCSAEHEHASYVSIGCFVCGGWETDESTDPGYYPDAAAEDKHFPSSCWDKVGHCHAHFDVIFY